MPPFPSPISSGYPSPVIRYPNFFNYGVRMTPTGVPGEYSTSAPSSESAAHIASEWTGRGATALELLNTYRLAQVGEMLQDGGISAADFFNATRAQHLLENSERFFAGVGYGADAVGFATDEDKFGAGIELAGKYFGKGLTFSVTGNPYLAEAMGELSGKMSRQIGTEDLPALYDAGTGLAQNAYDLTGIISDGWGDNTFERLDYVFHAGDVIRDTAGDGPWYRQLLGEGLAYGVEGLGTAAALGVGAYEGAGSMWDSLWSGATSLAEGLANFPNGLDTDFYGEFGAPLGEFEGADGDGAFSGFSDDYDYGAGDWSTDFDVGGGYEDSFDAGGIPSYEPTY